MKVDKTPLAQWVEEVATLTSPDKIHWCTGTKDEYNSLVSLMLKTKELEKLNPETYPNCYLYRSDPQDVARTEHLTYVCTPNKDDVGPNNNWVSPGEAHKKTKNYSAVACKDALFM